MSLSASSKTWLQLLRPRFNAHWWIKTTLIPLFVTGFFAAYFQLLRHPVFPPTVVPLTALDHLIPFHPWAMLPYASLWVYVLLAPAMLAGRREITVYCCEVAGLTAVGLGTFLFWPTVIPPPDIDSIKYPAFAFLKHVDAAGNACPSLHVAFAVFTAVWLARLLRQSGAPAWARLLNAVWCAAIVHSTLATKQHVAVDLYAGATLGGAAALFDPRLPATAFSRVARFMNRQSLALFVSITGKVTLFTLELHRTNPLMAVVLFLGPDLWILTGLLIPNTSCLVPTATRFRTTRREVWLTIDDGPDPSTTMAMLGLLDRHRAKATFFFIGERAAANPTLVAEVIRRGQNIGNHTQTHPLGTFWLAGPRRTAREIGACQAVLSAAGSTPDSFRCPAGIRTFFLRGALARRRMLLIGWTARAREHWSASIDRPLRRLTSKLRPGAILLIHESSTDGAQRVALLSALLDHLAAAGYTCVIPAPKDLE